MLKLSLEKTKLTKVNPYFKMCLWNLPENSMKTYQIERIEGSDMSVLKNYLSNYFILEEKIKNNKVKPSDLRMQQDPKKNSMEEPYKRYFYDIGGFAIPLIIEDNCVCPVEMEYVKYFDEYGVEYDVKIEKVSDLLNNF